MNGLITIEKDLFSISDRLKEIDARYVLYRNPILHRFEVYVEEALQFVVPFQKLDARTLDFARKTRVERVRKLVKEMDETNEILQKRKEREIIDSVLRQVEI